MNMFERSAQKRAEKQLRPLFEPGERVLDFDIGRTPQGEEAHAVATTHALYLIFRGGRVGRFAYRDWVSLGATHSVIAFGEASGIEMLVDFGRSTRGLPQVVHAQAQPLLTPREDGPFEGLTAPAQYTHLLYSQRSQNGPGRIRIVNSQPVFLSEGGGQSALAWDWFKSYRETPEGFALVAADGDVISVTPTDREVWRRCLESSGVGNTPDTPS